MRKGFTLIELIFAIVIIGVLAAVAVPQFGKLKQSAEITKVAEAIGSIDRTAKAVYYNERTLMGNNDDLTLSYFVKVEGTGWEEGTNTITYTGEGFVATFTWADPLITMAVTGTNAPSVVSALNSRTGHDINSTNTLIFDLNATLF